MNILLLSFANIVQIGTQWVIVIVIARNAGVVAAGEYALILAIMSPIFAFGNLGLRQYLATDDPGKTLEPLIPVFLLGLFVSTLAVLTVYTVWDNFSQLSSVLILILFISKVVESLFFISYGLYQQSGKIDYISLSLLLRGMMTLGAFALVYIFSNSYLYALTGGVLANLTVLFAHDYISKFRVLIGKRIIYDLGDAERSAIGILIICLPLGSSAFLNLIVQNIPRYALEQYYGSYELGIYSTIAYVALIGTSFVNAVGQASISKLSSCYKRDNFTFKKLLLKMIVLVLIIGILGIIFSIILGEEALSFLYGSSVAEFSHILVLAMIWSAISYVSAVVGCGITAMKKFKTQLIITFIMLFLTTVTCFYIIPIFGLEGAFVSIIGMSLVKLALQLLVLAKDFGSVVNASA